MDCIKVWRFSDAPQDYQNLSSHGGDEDWLAFVPSKYENDWIMWLEVPHFACCDVSVHEVENGTVHIGSHA